MRWPTFGRQLLLPVVSLLLIGGIVATALGDDGLAHVVWVAGSGLVAIELVATTIWRLGHGRLTVDLVALMAIAGALALDELLAASVIALMVASGSALERFAHRRAERELSALLSLAPRVAHRRTTTGYEDVGVGDVRVGDEVLVRPGEVVPVDGVTLGPAVVDESVLTGEAQPVERGAGERVSSGSVDIGGAFSLRAVSTFDTSAYAGIVQLVRAAGIGRAPFVRLADRYALVFIPVVLAVAGGAWALSGDAVRALAVLVVATPCPLVLAAPIAIVSGISASARRGVIVKDGAALEAMAATRTLLVDKTGTLTGGRASLVGVVADPELGEAEALRLAASVEQASSHVLAAALVDAARARGLELEQPEDAVEDAGASIGGSVGGRLVRVGSVAALAPGVPPRWMAAGLGVARREGSTTVAVTVDGAPVALVLLADELRVDASRALRAIRRAGIDRIVMVSGDRLEIAEAIGRSIGVDAVYADRSPAEKVEVVRSEAAARPGATMMVGDGVNDAPALAAADVGVAMGARGATASSEAADAVLVVDRLDRVADAIVTAKRAQRIARQSVLLGMGLSFVGMAAAAVGVLVPLAGAVAQEVIDVVAIGNSLRVLRRPRTGARVTEVPEAWVQQLAGAHGPLRVLLDDVRSTAGRLGELDGREARRVLQELCDRIRDDLIPHEWTDEAEIYPVVAATLRGDDPLAAMSRGHQEIFHLTTVLDRIVAGSGDEMEPADRGEALRLLYALDAVLRLHFAQEEELLATLEDGPATAGPPRAGPPTAPVRRRRAVPRRAGAARPAGTPEPGARP